MLGRSVILNFAGQFGSLALGFVSSIILARWLGPSDRGVLAVMTSVSTLALTVTAFGVPMAVMYFGSLRDARTGAILGTTLAVGTALAAVLVPGTWALRGWVADVLSHGRSADLWVLAAALVPLSFVDWTTHNQLLGKLRFGLYNLLVVLSKATTLALILALVVVVDGGVAGGLVATAAASVVMIAGSLPPLLGTRPRFDGALLRQMLGYGARVQIGAIFGTLNYRLDVVVLQAFKPLSAVGVYIVAQIIAELVTTFASAFQSSVVPLVAGSEGEARRRTTIAAIRHHGILALAATLVNAGFGTLVILYAYGHAFDGAVRPMLILLPGMWFLGTGAVVTSDLRGRGRPGLASGVSGVAVFVTVALDLVLIPQFGISGAAVASLCAYVSYGVLSLGALARVSGIPVRELVTPTRADLAAYPAALRRTLQRARA